MSVWDTLPPDDNQSNVWGNLPPETAEDKRNRLSQPDPALEPSWWEKIAQWAPITDAAAADAWTAAKRGIEGAGNASAATLSSGIDFINKTGQLGASMYPKSWGVEATPVLQDEQAALERNAGMKSPEAQNIVNRVGITAPLSGLGMIPAYAAAMSTGIPAPLLFGGEAAARSFSEGDPLDTVVTKGSTGALLGKVMESAEPLGKWAKAGIFGASGAASEAINQAQQYGGIVNPEAIASSGVGMGLLPLVMPGKENLKMSEKTRTELAKKGFTPAQIAFIAGEGPSAADLAQKHRVNALDHLTPEQNAALIDEAVMTPEQRMAKLQISNQPEALPPDRSRSAFDALASAREKVASESAADAKARAEGEAADAAAAQQRVAALQPEAPVPGEVVVSPDTRAAYEGQQRQSRRMGAFQYLIDKGWSEEKAGEAALGSGWREEVAAARQGAPQAATAVTPEAPETPAPQKSSPEEYAQRLQAMLEKSNGRPVNVTASTPEATKARNAEGQNFAFRIINGDAKSNGSMLAQEAESDAIRMAENKGARDKSRELNAADQDALDALTHPEAGAEVRNALREKGQNPERVIAQLRARISERNGGSPVGEPAPVSEPSPITPRSPDSVPGNNTVQPVPPIAPKTMVEVTHEGRGGSLLRIRPYHEGFRILSKNDGMTVIVNTDLGRVRVKDVELPAELRGTGMGTELYLRALEEAQKRGYAFESLDGRSPSANSMYTRLERYGVPIEEGQDGSLVIPADKLASLDINAIRATLESGAKPQTRAAFPIPGKSTDSVPADTTVQPVAEKAPIQPEGPPAASPDTAPSEPSYRPWEGLSAKEKKAALRKAGVNPVTVDLNHDAWTSFDEAANSVALKTRGKADLAAVLQELYPQDPTAPEGVQSMGGATDPAGALLSKVFGKEPKADSPGIGFSDPAVEARWQAAKGIKPESRWSRFKGGLTSAKHSFTRHFIDLDTKHNPVDAQVADILRQQEAVPELAGQKAWDTVNRITRETGLNQTDLVERILGMRDQARMMKTDLYKDKELPFGLKNEADVKSELARFEEYANRPENVAVKRALAAREVARRGIVKGLVDAGEAKPNSLNDPDYYHRQVIEHMEQKNALEKTGKGIAPGKKTFQMKRTGGGDFNTRYHEAELEWMAQAHNVIESAKNRAKLKSLVDILPQLKAEAEKQTAATGKEVKWQSLIPEGHTIWQPKPGNKMFPGLTITENALDRFISGEMDNVIYKENGLPRGVNEARVLAGPNEMWVIPDNIAKTLDTMKASPDGVADAFARGMQTKWKQYVLFNPLRATRYLLNNTSGDLDAAIAADPKILVYAVRNAKDLWDYMIKHNASPELEARMQDLMRRRVIGSGLTSQEIPGMGKSGALSAVVSTDPNVIMRAAKTYFNGVKQFNAFRESVLRASAYDRAMELMKNGKKVHWASNANEVDALPDMQDRAAKVATELLGDYGNISHAGEYIRSHLMPFWSWQEINAPRYARLFKNAATDSAGGAARAGAVIAKRAATNLAGFAFRATVLSGMVAAWNKVKFPDDQEAIAALGRGKPVLVLGKTADGQLHYVRFEGALADALDWAGAGNVIQDVSDVATGKATLGDKAAEAVKAPVNRLVQSWEPFSKTTFELATGRAVYPNIFEEGKSFKLRSNPIRDRGEHLARVVSLDKLWDWAHDKPSSGPKTSAAWKVSDALATYSANPDESSYFESRRLANNFVKDTLKREPFGGGDITDRQNALYYFKKAARWGDEEKARKWLRKWVELSPPGTKAKDLDRALNQSLQAGNPLGSIPTKYHQAFMDSLDPKQKAMVARAVQWYYGSKKK